MCVVNEVHPISQKQKPLKKVFYEVTPLRAIPVGKDMEEHNACLHTLKILHKFKTLQEKYH